MTRCFFSKLYYLSVFYLSITTALITAFAARSNAEPHLYIHDENGVLASVDIQSGQVNVIGNMGATMTDVAFNSRGELFAVDHKFLYRVSPETGQSIVIGPHGIVNANALVFSTNDVLYAAAASETFLYTLNSETGAGTQVADIGYLSAGDLAFFGEDLLVSGITPVSDSLIKTPFGSRSTSELVGPIGFLEVLGLAVVDGTLYATADGNILSIDPSTGAGQVIVSLTPSNAVAKILGSTYFSEAGAPDEELFKEDSDGDGVSDGDEIVEGTDENDPGSVIERLSSPAYVKWNTFLGQSNFLELLASGSVAFDVLVTVYNLDGQIIRQTSIPLEPGVQRDLDINAMVGFTESYGLIRLDFDDSLLDSKLISRLSHYRLDKDQPSYSFAFARELLNPSFGTLSLIGNSFDPQAKGFLVPNWVEIINLNETSWKGFTYQLFSQEGHFIEERSFFIPPLGERDVHGGHELGEGVYFIRVIPEDLNSGYIATLARYSSNSNGGAEADTYNFAFVSRGKKGTADPQIARVSNKSGGCWNENNWISAINASNSDITALLQFYSSSGTLLKNQQVQLNRRSQRHFFAGDVIPKGQSGLVVLNSEGNVNLLLESTVYYRDCQDGGVQTAYLAPGRLPGFKTQSTSYNRFLNIWNQVNVLHMGDKDAQFTISSQREGSLTGSQAFSTTKTGLLETNVNTSTFQTNSNTYGQVLVEGSQERTFITEAIRSRTLETDSSRLDFSMYTVGQ